MKKRLVTFAQAFAFALLSTWGVQGLGSQRLIGDRTDATPITISGDTTMNRLRLLILFFAATLAMPVEGQDKKAASAKSAEGNMQILRDKVKADENRVVANKYKINGAAGQDFLAALCCVSEGP